MGGMEEDPVRHMVRVGSETHLIPDVQPKPRLSIGRAASEQFLATPRELLRSSQMDNLVEVSCFEHSPLENHLVFVWSDSSRGRQLIGDSKNLKF